MAYKDVSKPRTLFEFHGKLFETIGYADQKTVIVQPVRSEDYDKCECGRPLPNQQHEFVHSAPILQEHIGRVYHFDEPEKAALRALIAEEYEELSVDQILKAHRQEAAKKDGEATPVTGMATTDSSEPQNASNPPTSPPSPQPTEAELEIHALMHQPSHAVIYPETEAEEGYLIAKRILAWHLTQLQALKQAGPKDSLLNPARKILDPKNYASRQGRNQANEQWRTLIDTYIARIKGTK